MANTDNAFSFRFVKSGHGDAGPPVNKGTASSNTTLAFGDPLHLETDGYIDLAAGSDAVLGFAAEPATGVASTTQDLSYYVARNGDQWKAQWSTGTTVSQANIGDTVGFTGTTGAVELVATTSGPLAAIALSDEPDNALGAHAVVDCVVMNAQYGDASV